MDLPTEGWMGHLGEAVFALPVIWTDVGGK